MRRLLLFPLCALLTVGCGGSKKDPANTPQVDPDGNSGPDAKRTGAMMIAANKLTRPDEVNFDKQDMTDWKSFELGGAPGQIAVLLHWDDDKADLNVDLFDRSGEPLATSPGRTPGGQEKRLSAPIYRSGMYYVRVTAPHPHEGSVYTMRIDWKPSRSESDEDTSRREKLAEKVEPQPEVDPSDREGALHARVVAVKREEDATLLTLNRGNAAGIQVGQEGVILKGESGEHSLDGGGFRITEVSSKKAVARTEARDVSDNARVVIFVEKR